MPCHACQFTDASQSSRRVRSDRSFVRMQFMGLVSCKYKEIEMDSEIYEHYNDYTRQRHDYARARVIQSVLRKLLWVPSVLRRVALTSGTEVQLVRG